VFILLILIGWFFASIAKRLVRAILRKLRFERAITLSPAGNYITRIIEHPTSFVSKIAYWIVFLAFISFAISSLNVPALNLMIYGIYKYIPNIIAALIIFLVASAVTIGAEAFIQKMFRSSPFSKVLGAVVPALIMPIAIFMILNQLKVATDIVNITYTALMGSVALGLALAFGLGGRDVASRILEQAYSSAQLNSGQMRDEMRQAASNTKQQAKNARGRLQDQV
jgi:small-conductance mechanosensitive channel